LLIKLRVKTGVSFGWGDLFRGRVIDIDPKGSARMIVFVKSMKKCPLLLPSFLLFLPSKN
jgi:hypothetical protein